MDPTDYASQLSALQDQLATDRFAAVAGLRVLEEEFARALLGLASTHRPTGGWAFDAALVADVRRLVERSMDPALAADAEAHLAGAEEWQWEIGTWSTGSGEGLASMFEVRSLQLARAWLLAARATTDADLGARARELAQTVADDPNDIAARHRAHVDALLAFVPAR